MNAVKVDSAKRIRLTVLTPGDYYEPEILGKAAEEITLRRTITIDYANECELL